VNRGVGLIGMKRKIIAGVVIILGLIALSPMTARLGRWHTVHTWKAPSATFGLDRPLWLSVETFHAFVDPLRLYEEHRIVITDGGYAYIINVELNFYDEISSANVEWRTNDITFSVPSWIKLVIPKERVISQVGS
jgi:hypothetical protein